MDTQTQNPDILVDVTPIITSFQEICQYDDSVTNIKTLLRLLKEMNLLDAVTLHLDESPIVCDNYIDAVECYYLRKLSFDAEHLNWTENHLAVENQRIKQICQDFLDEESGMTLEELEKYRDSDLIGEIMRLTHAIWTRAKKSA